MRTIRARLLVWLLSAVCAAGLSGAYTIYGTALTGAGQVFDEQLQQTALSLRDQSFEFALPPPWLSSRATLSFVPAGKFSGRSNWATATESVFRRPGPRSALQPVNSSPSPRHAAGPRSRPVNVTSVAGRLCEGVIEVL